MQKCAEKDNSMQKCVGMSDCNRSILMRLFFPLTQNCDIVLSTTGRADPSPLTNPPYNQLFLCKPCIYAETTAQVKVCKHFALLIWFFLPYRNGCSAYIFMEGIYLFII